MKLIMTDIDGTLIDHERKLPHANVRALAEAHARGVRLSVATVRKRDAALKIVNMLGVPCMVVCQAGAAIYDENGATMQTISIPIELASAIAAICDAEHLPLCTTVDEVNYFGPGLSSLKVVVAPGVQVARNHDALHTAPTRLIIRGEVGVTRLMRAFAAAPLRFVRHYEPDGTLYDAAITHIDATKERAFDLLCARLQIAPADVLALGDAEADIGMISRAGVGVAMGDARPEVRAAADWVAPPAAEAGLAAAVRRFVLV